MRVQRTAWFDGPAKKNVSLEICRQHSDVKYVDGDFGTPVGYQSLRSLLIAVKG
jgi:hypothetical protein